MTKSKQLKMVRSLAAFAIFASLAAAVIALPGFAPKVEASEVTVLAKADRLKAFKAPSDCARQVWPDFASSCLKTSVQSVVEARLVTARR